MPTPEEVAVYMKNWRLTKMAEGKCIRCGKAKDRVDRTRCETCRHKESIKMQEGHIGRNRSKSWSYRLREQVLNAYGHACACCGETRTPFLTMDHPKNDGATHRRTLAGNDPNKKTKRAAGPMFSLWLRRNNFPKEFRILCWNCNCSRHFYGHCPHEDDIRDNEPTLMRTL